MAIAWSRLVTTCPDLPDLRRLRFISCIARSTLAEAFGE
jgi:hypothetical protein